MLQPTQKGAAERERCCCCREEEDARQRAVVDAAEALQRRMQEKAAALGPAPQRGSPDTTAVRIRLKDGSSHQRVFSAQDSLQVVTVPSLMEHGAQSWSFMTPQERQT